jgi:hypothetical protein
MYLLGFLGLTATFWLTLPDYLREPAISVEKSVQKWGRSVPNPMASNAICGSVHGPSN